VRLAGFVVAVLGSAVYGVVLGIAIFAIYTLLGSPGSTGLEIIAVPILVLQATLAGTIAAVVAFMMPRESLRGSDNFFLLVAVAVVLQALVALSAFLMSQSNIQTSLLWWTLLTSGPIDWSRRDLNSSWLYTVPLTLTICSSWFRTRF
jgi:hypothetical protein